MFSKPGIISGHPRWVHATVTEPVIAAIPAEQNPTYLQKYMAGFEL